MAAITETVEMEMTSTTSTLSASPPPSEPFPSPSIVETPPEEENWEYLEDPICKVMDLLNFSVVQRPPLSIIETPLPPGELMSKSQHYEEKTYLLGMIKSQKRQILKAQWERMDAITKLQLSEKKLQRLATIMAELHCLYGQFVKCLVVLLIKNKICDEENTKFSLSIGSPCVNEEEVDKMLTILTSLSNQLFQSINRENLSKITQILSEVGTHLKELARKNGTENIIESSPEVDYNNSCSLVEGFSGGEDSCGGDSISSGASTLIMLTPEGETLTPPANFVDEGISNPFNIYDGGNPNEVPEPQTAEPAARLVVTPPPSVTVHHEILPTPSSSSSSVVNNGGTFIEITSAFLPVPALQQPESANGMKHYTLVEYPQKATAVKKHNVDILKCQEGNGLFCICGQKFGVNDVSLLRYHIRYFTAKWKFLCKICKRRYPGINFLKLHMLRSHKIVYAGMHDCRYCRHSFQTANELLRHLKTVQ